MNAQSCTCLCAVRWAGPDCSGMLHTGKIKRKMLRAVHVVLELFMNQMLTVQNLSVTSKISCKAKPKVVPFFHFPRRPPYRGTG